MERRGSGRAAEIERAMRAHPAGGALRRRGEGRGEVEVRWAPADESPGRVPLRLTPRGRRLVAVLGLAAGVGAAALVGSVADRAAAADSMHLAGQASVVVRPGDTLWSIASSVAGDEDVRVVIDRIEQINGLRRSDLVPGQVLRLP